MDTFVSFTSLPRIHLIEWSRLATDLYNCPSPVYKQPPAIENCQLLVGLQAPTEQNTVMAFCAFCRNTPVGTYAVTALRGAGSWGRSTLSLCHRFYDLLREAERVLKSNNQRWFLRHGVRDIPVTRWRHGPQVARVPIVPTKGAYPAGSDCTRAQHGARTDRVALHQSLPAIARGVARCLLGLEHDRRSCS
jgi:hypothetical protein